MPAAKQSKTTEPKRVLKGHRVFFHDLFKLKVAKMTKNTTDYKPFVFTPIELEHTHVFHSVSERGVKREYCAPVGGHFHKVTVTGVDEHGQPKAECGPPLRFIHRRLHSGNKRMVRRMAPIEHEYENSNDGSTHTFVDKHTHEVEYIDSEELSQAKRQAQREAQKAEVQSMMDKSHVATQAAALLKQADAKPPVKMEETTTPRE